MQQDPFQQVTTIGAIDPDAAQFLARSAQALEEQFGSGSIGERGFRDDHDQQQAQGVYQDVSLAPFHLFACVIATLPRPLGRFDALAIQGSCCRMFMATSTLAHLRPERVMHSVPGAIITPLPKVAVHTLPRRIVPWEHAPLTAGDQQIQDPIDYRSHLQRAWLASWLCRRNEVFDTIPLTVGQIGWIYLVRFHPPSVPPRFSAVTPFSNRLLEDLYRTAHEVLQRENSLTC